VGVRDERRGLAMPLEEVFLAGARFALEDVFFAGAAFLAGALAGAGDAFLDEDFFVGARLVARVGAGAASSALVVGLRSRFGLPPAELLPDKSDATISNTCTTMPSARIPTVTPATSAIGESIFVSACLAAAFILRTSLCARETRVRRRGALASSVVSSSHPPRARRSRRHPPFDDVRVLDVVHTASSTDATTVARARVPRRAPTRLPP